MSISAKRMTADELLRMPDDNLRHELIQGELTTMTPPGFEHGVVTLALGHLLMQYVKEKGLGWALAGDPGFLLQRDPDTVLAPDVAFIRSDRVPAGPLSRKYFDGPPDLAVEVVYQWDTLRELDAKARRWLHFGARLAWIVNPRDRSVSVYRPSSDVQVLSANETLDGGDVIPGFQVRVGELFQQGQ